MREETLIAYVTFSCSCEATGYTWTSCIPYLLKDLVV